MSAIITFDDMLWPLLIVRVSGTMSDKQYAGFLTRSSTYVERGEQYVSVMDLGQVGLPSAAQRVMQAEWIRKHDAELRERVLGNANIVTSAPVRLALSLIFHLKSLPMPCAAVSDMDSALRYVTGKLEESGRAAEAERIRRHCGGLSGIKAS